VVEWQGDGPMDGNGGLVHEWIRGGVGGGSHEGDTATTAAWAVRSGVSARTRSYTSSTTSSSGTLSSRRGQ
jgi:hypothetical protein